MAQTRLETDRLILRQPELSDFEPLCALMADETVTRFIGGVQEPALVWRNLCGIVGHWALRGYGFFSVIEKESGRWLGRVGPWYPHGWPQPEIGWSLNRDSWGKGYATEAASACMDFAVDVLAGAMSYISSTPTMPPVNAWPNGWGRAISAAACPFRASPA